MINKEDKVILVTGATGHQGGEVARSLLQKGWKVDAFTRGGSAGPVSGLKSLGARIVTGDMEDKASLDKAMKGVYGVFLVTTSMQGGPEGEIKRGKLVADAAKNAGVKHFIFSSVGAADRHTGIPFFESKREIELYIGDKGISYTFFRPVSFMINFEQPGTRDSILAGKLITPFPENKREQYIALEDLGAFVNIAFENPDNYIGKEIELASDELTLYQVADSFSMILGQTVKVENIPLESILKQMGEGYYKMNKWHMENSFKADIGALKKIYPGLTSFDSYLRKHEWQKMRLFKAA
jgi:uncharacterized protein YbjT (DUF2867 family)